MRALLVQSAQNALPQRICWKLALKKHRNLAVAAVARKLVTAMDLLKGHFTPLLEMTKQLQLKLSVIAGILDAQRHGL